MEKGKILIVDDERIILRAYKLELEDAGFAVQTVDSAEQARIKIENEHFDLVFVDLILPGTTGVDVCSIVKKVSPETQVCLISGHPLKISENQSAFWKAGGMRKILRKPLLGDELTQTAREVIHKIQPHNQKN